METSRLQLNQVSNLYLLSVYIVN